MSKPGYDIVMSERTLENINMYKDSLISGEEQPGKFLREKLEETGKSLEDLSTAEFIEVILSTKKPKFFAESAIQGGGRDWNNTELAILGDINVTVPVQVYDNGIWHPADPNFAAHANPLDGELLFTPGALLKSGAQFSGQTPDLAEVTKNGKIDQEAYNALVERRLLPLLVHANEKAGLEGKPALITLPGVGAGEFAGKFKGEMGQHLNIAMQAMLEKHSGNLGNIAAIHYDSFGECQNEQRNYGNIKYRVRPKLQGNQDKTQLSDPTAYQEQGDDFSKCKLYKVVAWDHVSLPGNDFFIGSRHTDDGVAAAATNSMEGITGVKGHYDKATGKYLPPKGYKTWEEVANAQGVHLKVQNNIKIVTDKGVSVKLADYQRVVIPKPPQHQGYKDVSTIIGKTKPAGLSEVGYIKDSNNQNNYLLNFANKQDAINYSDSLAKYGVRGSQGNKYVNELPNGQYQIVLNDANIVTLQQNKSLNPPPPVHTPASPPPPSQGSQAVASPSDGKISKEQASALLKKYKKDLEALPDKLEENRTNYRWDGINATNIINALTAIAQGKNDFIEEEWRGTAHTANPNQFLNDYMASSNYEDLAKRGQAVSIDLSNLANEIRTGVITQPELPKQMAPAIPKPPQHQGYKDVSTIIGKTKPAGLSEVGYIKDSNNQNNYLLNFANKQDAINYSDSLAKYGVRGSQGNKYVNELPNGQYQIVLNDANIVTLQQNKLLNQSVPPPKPVLSPKMHSQRDQDVPKYSQGFADRMHDIGHAEVIFDPSKPTPPPPRVGAPTIPPPPPPRDRSQESQAVASPSDGQDQQLSEQYVKKELVPMINKFVASHTNGKAVTEPEIRKFYTDVLSKLQNDGYISDDNIKSFTKPLNGSTTSQLDQAVNSTALTINNKDIVPIELGISEKLMFSLSKVATILNIPRMREFCLSRIKPENLQKITDRENILAQSIDIISNIQGSNKTTGPKAAQVVAARGANRTGRGL